MSHYIGIGQEVKEAGLYAYTYAYEDALAKARVLTGAAGVSLRDILNIDYSWGEVAFEVQPLRRSLEADMAAGSMNAKASFDMDIEPDDIRVSDTVTVVWEIA